MRGTDSEESEMNDFALDLDRIRVAARQHLETGPVTDEYGMDVARVIDVLNEVLATELVCVLRYKRHYYMAKGLHGAAVAAEFLEHAADEQRHADLAAERIAQLGGEPDFNPDVLAKRSHTEYVPGGDLLDMIREDLVAERIAVATYAEIVRWLGDGDPTTRRLIERLLAEEEGHAEDLRNLLDRLDT
jgi:bacterioferritin